MNAITEAKPIRVLLVEDEFLISEWVADSLCQQGFAVRTAANAKDALRHLTSAPVDVLFTDINLPGGMEGTTLARRARELVPDLPVLYASGAAVMLDFTARVPGSVFIAKPYDPVTVGRVLKSITKANASRVPA